MHSNRREKKISISIMLANIMILLLGINYLVYSFFNDIVFKNSLRFFIVILLIVTLFIKAKLRFFDIILLFLSVYLLLINGTLSLNVVFLFLIMIVFSTWQLNDICKVMNLVNILCLIVVIISLSFGIVQNVNWTYLGRTRNTLGFFNVNSVGILSYSISAIYLLTLKKINWYNTILIFIFALGVYILSDSRTGFFSLIILIILFYLLKNTKNLRNIYIIFGIEVVCLLSPMIWKIPVINSVTMNKILSLRPSIFNAYINRNTWINFFFGGSKVNEVDNFFLVFFFGVGIGIYIVFGIMVIWATKNIFLKGEYLKVAFVVSMLIMGLTESSIVRPEILCVPYFWIMIYSETWKLKGLK